MVWLLLWRARPETVAFISSACPAFIAAAPTDNALGAVHVQWDELDEFAERAGSAITGVVTMPPAKEHTA